MQPPQHQVNRVNLDTGYQCDRPGKACFRGRPDIIKGLGVCTSIRDLKGLDQRCVLVVRRITHLGFRAQAALSEHFASFGEVRGVFAPKSQARSIDKRRVRRPTLAFVVMADSAASEAVLAVGQDHEVGGQDVNVERYQESSGKSAMQRSTCYAPSAASSLSGGSCTSTPSPVASVGCSEDVDSRSEDWDEEGVAHAEYYATDDEWN